MGEHGNGGSERSMPYSHLAPRDPSPRNQTSGAFGLPGVAGPGEQQQDSLWPADAYLTPDQSTMSTDHIDPNSAAGQRFHTRRLIQEFLTSVPRGESEARLTFLRFDGTLRVLTRAELSEIVDNLRPRQRQLVRLAIEEHWPRQRVCDYLHISLKTFERQHQEVLNLLAQM